MRGYIEEKPALKLIYFLVTVPKVFPIKDSILYLRFKSTLGLVCDFRWV